MMCDQNRLSDQKKKKTPFISVSLFFFRSSFHRNRVENPNYTRIDLLLNRYYTRAFTYLKENCTALLMFTCAIAVFFCLKIDETDLNDLLVQ